MPSELLTHREEACLVLTLSDPATRNTLSPQVYAAGIEALDAADGDASIRCIVLRGDGAHFCAGGDLGRITAARERAPADQAASVNAFHDFVDAIRSCTRPVIAAVEGHAAGGGFSLALACDLIVAARDARFTMSYGRIGLSPDGGGSWHLAQALPRAVALELLWLAEPASAERLQALGLVHSLSEPGQSLGKALQLANRLAAMAPNAVAAVKALVQQAPGRSLRAHMDVECAQFIEQLFHANAGEGLEAFRAKRPPVFR